VDEPMSAGEIGYWITRAFEGRGLITKACRLFVDHGFRDRGLHRIEIHAAEDNVRSRAVAERLGFTHEARMRDGCRKPDGSYVDQVVYGLLEDEWPTA
jgi:ribosomal-protein-serine acetyltransferase